MNYATYLVTVESIGLDGNKIETTYHMLRAESFTEAVKQITDYFRNDLVGFFIKEYEDFCGEITKEACEDIVKLIEERY